MHCSLQRLKQSNTHCLPLLNKLDIRHPRKKGRKQEPPAGLSPVFKLSIRHPRKKERKFGFHFGWFLSKQPGRREHFLKQFCCFVVI